MLLPSNRDSTVDVEAFSSTEGHPCQIINLRKVVQIFVVFCRPVNLPGPKSGTWTRVLEFLDLQILHEEARLPGEMFLKAYGSCSLRTTCCVLALLECVTSRTCCTSVRACFHIMSVWGSAASGWPVKAFLRHVLRRSFGMFAWAPQLH